LGRRTSNRLAFAEQEKRSVILGSGKELNEFGKNTKASYRVATTKMSEVGRGDSKMKGGQKRKKRRHRSETIRTKESREK